MNALNSPHQTSSNAIEISKMIVNLAKEPTMNTKHYWFHNSGVQALEVSYE